MSEPVELHLEPMELGIIQFMRRQPETTYTPEELAPEVGATVNDVGASLAKLERLGLVAAGDTTAGLNAYNITPAANQL